MSRDTLDTFDPCEETARGLTTWPDAALFNLARDLAGEFHRRGLPTPAAMPVTAAAYIRMSGANQARGPAA